MNGRLLLAFGLGLEIAAAEELPTEPPHVELSVPADLFRAGAKEFSVNTGVMFSPVGSPDNRSTINYTVTGLELGWMLYDPKDLGLLSGNIEFLTEVFGNYIYEGEGEFIAGGTLWLRYNFIQEGWRFVPYAQGGAGLTWTDINQQLVGQPFNFNLNLGVGLRWLATSHFSVNLEYRYQHISNANSGDHNLGINSQGPILGVTWFF